MHRPTDDDHYVLIDLDFDNTAAATAFLSFLRSRIWSSSASSPTLAGEPTTRVLTVESDSPAA